jgi:hypothetical protein
MLVLECSLISRREQLRLTRLHKIGLDEKVLPYQDAVGAPVKQGTLKRRLQDDDSEVANS